MAGNGGRRPGAGRKKGSKLPKTLEKERTLREVKQRIYKIAQQILDSQVSLARGQQFLYKIEKEKIKGPKGGITYRNTKPKLVTDEAEVRDYLNGLVEEGDEDDEKDPGATYYFITTKEPNNMAIDSMMNRAFGTPLKSLELFGKDGEPLEIRWRK